MTTLSPAAVAVPLVQRLIVAPSASMSADRSLIERASQLHRVPAATRNVVVATDLLLVHQGVCRLDRTRNQERWHADCVLLPGQGRHIPTLLLHEIGHWVDGRVLSSQRPSRARYASTHHDLPLWQKAVEATEQVKLLRELGGLPEGRAETPRERIGGYFWELRQEFTEMAAPADKRPELSAPRIQKNLARGLLDPKELFARSYAQWALGRLDIPIPTDDDLWLTTSTMRSRGIGIDWDSFDVRMPMWWDADEFAPIAEALDEEFAHRGLL